MRGGAPPAIEFPIAFSVLLAEFDIDTGSCLRAKYPERSSCLDETGKIVVTRDESEYYPNDGESVFELGAYDEYCASHMLPDGAEKQPISRTVFVMNRSQLHQAERFPVYYFASSADPVEWVRNAKAVHPFAAELLHRDTVTGELSVRWRDRVIMDPLDPMSHGGLQVMPTLPLSVLVFAQQLHHYSALNDTETTMDAISIGNEEVGQVFVVIQAGSVRHGILLQSVHLEQLLRSIASRAITTTTVKVSTEVTDSLPVSSDIPPLYGLCAVVTRQDASMRRGGISKSVALVGFTLSWLEPFFPLLVETALQCCDVKGKSESSLEQQMTLLRRCHDAVNGAAELLCRQISAIGSVLEGDVIRLCTTSYDSTYVSYTLAPFGTPHHLQIPLSNESRHLTFLRYGLDRLLEVCGSSFWTLIMAILLEKRIVVLSRKGLPNDVCEAALSLGLIGNLLDPNFIARKVFPYTSVNGYPHFCNIPGYILGTLNPIFETHYAWWDVMCDIDNRSVLVSTSNASKKAIPSEGLDGVSRSPADLLFIKDLLARIYRMTALHVPSSERHHTVLVMLEEYLHLMVMVGNRASGSNCVMPRCLQNAFVTHAALRLRAQAHFTSTLNDMPRHGVFDGEGTQLLMSIAVLRRAAHCDETELLYALQHLLRIVRSEEEVLLFLRRMPLAFDGLNPLAAQLLHSSPAVRRATGELLQRIQGVSSGNAVLASMNNFLFLVYEESCRAAAATASRTQ